MKRNMPVSRWLMVAMAAAMVMVVVVQLQTAALAQEKKMHRVVFEVTMEGDAQWEAILNNVENLQKAFGKESTEIEVVAHGKGLGLLKKTNTGMKERIAAIAGGHARFVACENTMRRMQVKKEDLLPEAGTVDSGVAEVVSKQEAGWSYIKSGS